MSGATTATAISIAATVASTAMTIAGQAQQAQAQSAMHGYQAAVARNNQIMAERMAQDALQRGEAAEQKQRTRAGLMAGTQLARLAGQGTTLDGSPADLIGDTAAAGELESLTTRNAAEREAWSQRVKGAQYGSEADLAQFRQASAGDNGVGIATSLIAGAGSVADKWYRFEKEGAFRNGGSPNGSGFTY